MKSLLILCSLMGVAVVPRVADASCSTPEAHVYGTIPADGAVDVPTDTDIVVFGYPRPRALELDGEVVRQGPMLTYEVPDFGPNETHEVVFWLGEPEEEHRFTFTTAGAKGGGAIPPEPQVDAVTLSEEGGTWSSEPACPELPNSTGCPDEGNPVYATFDVAPSDAAGWFISAGRSAEFDLLWPASCEAPAWRGYYVDGCFAVRAVDERGHVSLPTIACAEAAAADDAGPDVGPAAEDMGPVIGTVVGGCSSIPGGQAHWLGLLALAFARRSRRR